LAQQKRIKDDSVRAKESIKDAETKPSLRTSDSFRSNEKLQDAESKRALRKDEAFRSNEKLKDAESKRALRKDESFRSNEKFQDASKQRDLRNDPNYRKHENDKEAKRKRLVRNSFKHVLERYEIGVTEGTDFVCVSCGGIFFRRSVYEFTNEKLMRQNLRYTDVVAIEIKFEDNLWICRTCVVNLLA